MSQFESNRFSGFKNFGSTYDSRGPRSFNTQGFGKKGSFQNDGLGKSLQTVNWTELNLEPFQKVFYLAQKNPTHDEKEIEEFKKSRHILVKTKGIHVPDPMITWEDTQFPDYILDGIHSANFQQPTTIQSIAFPIIMSGHDFIGIAQTGSGKTLAYLLPGIIHINAQAPIERGDGPIVLVLAPTRELAQQIEEQSHKFGATSKLTCACIFGGVDRYEQKGQLLNGCDVVIATPGRLIDFLESGTTNLRRVTYLVLDEADRMLDMGFQPQIRMIVEQIRPDRQTLMFSATWPKEVRNLAHDFCHESPLHIQIGNFQHSINQNIEQIFQVVDRHDKFQRLLEHLNSMTQEDKVLIFCQTKNGCDDLFSYLRENKYRTMVIHGDKKQETRDYVMESFRTGQTRVLIATDVASRGLDVKDISHVINYDFPKQIEDYIHRIGRTARAGQIGISISFLQPDEDQRIACDLISVLQEAQRPIPDVVYDLADRKRIVRPKTGAPRTAYSNGYSSSYVNQQGEKPYNGPSGLSGVAESEQSQIKPRPSTGSGPGGLRSANYSNFEDGSEKEQNSYNSGQQPYYRDQEGGGENNFFKQNNGGGYKSNNYNNRGPPGPEGGNPFGNKGGNFGNYNNNKKFNGGGPSSVGSGGYGSQPSYDDKRPTAPQSESTGARGDDADRPRLGFFNSKKPTNAPSVAQN